MTPLTPVTAGLLGALALGLGALFALLPLARRIPARLHRQWALDVELQARAAQDGPAESAYSYSLFERAVLVAVAMALGYLAVVIHGPQAGGAAFALYYFSLLLLVAINVKHALLPDLVVLPTLWVGLLCHTFVGSAPDHVYGAAAGYLVPFLLASAVKATTGKEVIGHGDFKMLAMAGAWFGLSALPMLLGGFVVGVVAWALVASLAGKVQGVVATGPAYLVASVAAALGTGLP